MNVYLSEKSMGSGNSSGTDGWFGVKSAGMLAPSAYLALAAATFPSKTLYLLIINSSIQSTYESHCPRAKNLIFQTEAARLWNATVTSLANEDLLSRCLSQFDKARLTAVKSHAGNWLNAPPITLVGLLLSDEVIRGADGFSLLCINMSVPLVLLLPSS